MSMCVCVCVCVQSLREKTNTSNYIDVGLEVIMNKEDYILRP